MNKQMWSCKERTWKHTLIFPRPNVGECSADGKTTMMVALRTAKQIRNSSEKSLLHYDCSKRLEGDNIYKKLCPITIGWARYPVNAHVRYMRKGRMNRLTRSLQPGFELIVVPLSAFNNQSPANLSADAMPSLLGCRIQYSKMYIKRSHYSNSELIYMNWYLLQ
jgi:hypothetical protein